MNCRTHLFVLLGLCGALLSCSDTQQPTKLTANQLAMVNGQPITSKQFEAELHHLARFRASRLFSEDQKKVILVDMVNFEMLLQEAAKQHLHLQDEEIRRLMVKQYLKRNVNQTYTPNETEIRKIYAANRATIDNICVRHILIGLQSRSEAQAQSIVDEVQEKLRKGQAFGALAAKYSDDRANREYEGNLGCINSQTQFVPEFLQAAFALKEINQISPPVRTPYGFHLIQLTADNRDFEANREVITRQLENDHNKQVYEALLLKLREKAKIETNFSSLQDINLPAVETPMAAPAKP